MIQHMGVETLQAPVKRIDRSNDENLYQPKIHSTRIRELYQIGQQFNLPLTVIVDRAIELYVSQLYDDGILITCDQTTRLSASEPGRLVEGGK
jgi:hypothetical protein